jgi:hypothetical protein
MFDKMLENAGTLNASKDQTPQALSLPGNTERVYLDVVAQNEANDEFWYLCVPNDQITTLESCDNTAFRETEIAHTPNGIDRQHHRGLKPKLHHQRLRQYLAGTR